MTGKNKNKNKNKNKKKGKNRRNYWRYGKGISKPRNYLTFTRSATTVYTLTANASTPFYGAVSFKFSEIINSAEFEALFDQYKINWVKLSFVPMGYTESMDLVTTAKIGIFTYVIDYDDEASPTSITELDQYPGVKRCQMNKGFSLKIYPRFAMATYLNGLSSGFGARRGFLDLAYPAIPHYGFKFYITPTILANVSQYNMYVKYCCTVKGIR